MSDYEFNEAKIKDLTNNTEETSAVSIISYEVENALINKVPIKEIGLQNDTIHK